MSADILDLRDYQSEAIEATVDAWSRGINRPAVVLPTGTGKTVIFAHLSRNFIDCIDDTKRVLVLVHRDELVQQAMRKLHSVAPHLDIGIVKASRNDVEAHVIVASVQTLRSDKRISALRNVGLIIVDECHHATANSYMNVLRELGAFRGMCLAVGFTATMKRTDGQALGDVWQEVVYEKDIIWAIRNGHLTDVRGIGLTVADFDMSEVRKTAGDYSERDLGHALEESSAPKIIADAYHEHAPTEPGLIFCPTVDTAELMADTMQQSGISAAAISGNMPTTERRNTLEAFDDGKIQVLANCMVLTEGFDSPRASVCVVARPTMSAPLYIQMVGRVLRKHPAKAQALVLDVAGASARHSLMGLTTLAGAEVYDDESLLDAADRELAAEMLDEIEGADYGAAPRIIEIHASEQRELDLFHGSRQTWLRTDDGWWFIPAGDKYVAIIPGAPGTWSVGWYGRTSGGGAIQQNVESLDYARAWGEKFISDTNQWLTSKESAWRKKAATSKAIEHAKRLGVDLTPDDEGKLRGGILGDRISQRMASERIDWMVRNWLQQQGRTP